MHRRHHYEMDMCSGTLLPKIIRFTLPLVLTGVLPVSYTHLDVYKRQTWSAPPR